MSLVTDIIFVKALQQNSTLMQMLPAGGVYNTAIAVPDADLNNAPVPYIIVTFDGMQNDSFSKDAQFEGEDDKVQIGIEVAAETREQLGEMVTLVRNTIKNYFENLTYDDEDYSLVPVDYALTATGVSYDPDKPCFWQILNYNCDVNV